MSSKYLGYYGLIMPLMTELLFSKLVSTVLHHCIKQLLNGDGENTIYVDRFLLSLFSHCAKDQNHLNAMKHIEVACSCENFRHLSNEVIDLCSMYVDNSRLS